MPDCIDYIYSTVLWYISIIIINFYLFFYLLLAIELKGKRFNGDSVILALSGFKLSDSTYTLLVAGEY